MKKWFSNWISGLRNGSDVPNPENIPHFKKIEDKSIRLKPVNKWPKNQKPFNCMSYFIFCPKHQKIAVCDNHEIHRELAVWLPFIYLSPDIEQRLTEVEGLSFILSDGDSKLMAKYKKERPFDTNVYEVSIFDFYLAKINYTKFICIARLHSDNPGFQCCRKTSRILWMCAEDFRNDDISCLWSSILKPKEIYRFLGQTGVLHFCFDEYYMEWMLDYELEAQPRNQGQQTLKSLKITEKQIGLFLYDYIEHCFPTPVMSLVSFKDYLRKYCEFSVEDKWLRRLFNGCANHSNEFGSYVYFNHFFLCLAYLDIECPSYECRLLFVFRYYDFDRDGYLSEEELREMVRDIDTNQSQEVIERVVSDNMFMNESEKGISLQEFQFRVEENWLEGTDRLCRFDFPILRKILSDLELKEKWCQRSESGFKKRLNQYFRRLLND